MDKTNELIYRRYDLHDSADFLRIQSWIGTGKKILEVACHTSDLGKLLKENGNYVVGIDYNEKAIQVAKTQIDEAHQVDLRSDDLFFYRDEKYDVIICNHILEHLIDPEEVLRKLIRMLKNNGEIIIGLPNICNAKNRFHILSGRFNYEETGVMDITHLRFYNYYTAQNFIEKNNLQIIEYFSPLQVNPVKEFIDHLPVIYRISKFFSNRNFVFNFSPNLTDVVMLFRCGIK